MAHNIPRAEYPRPQMVRSSYIPLNGTWMFEIDNGYSGVERGLITSETLSDTITVPFCPESKLSGIENKDFMRRVWYKRKINVELHEGKRVLFHIDACDYGTALYVNGTHSGGHLGGFSPMVFDITDKLQNGDNIITICAEDDVRCCKQPGGKQAMSYYSEGCSYSRTTGIWQSVWMEEVPETYITKMKFTPHAKQGEVVCEIFCENANGKTVTVETAFDGKATGAASAPVNGTYARMVIALSETHLWDVGVGNLYDVKITVGEDVVTSYFGLRDVYFDGKKCILNGRPVYQRLVLDQGYYPDGIMTAPSDAELIADIDRSLAMGFNGARLHQKVFEPRFLYHCDRKGYIVWGEHGNWGMDVSMLDAWRAFLPEWLEIMERDYNHPAIIGWCPLNETQENQDPRFVEMLYNMTKAYDPYRMFIDCSGWYHVKTEIVDGHDYNQDPVSFRENYEALKEGKAPPMINGWNNYQMDERVTFISEYGGIAWAIGEGAWGYGNTPQSEEEFVTRLRGLTDVLLDNECLSGFCYTQLTDIEQEQNGLYTYERQAKFPPEIIHPIFSRKAAIEE